jgi:hypothetical protein
MNTIGTAQGYIMGKSVAPARRKKPDEECRCYDQFRSDYNNTFHDKHWKAYRQFVEGTRVSLFKDYEPINNDSLEQIKSPLSSGFFNPWM